jgi:SAM-dependent methyltransferase
MRRRGPEAADNHPSPAGPYVPTRSFDSGEYAFAQDKKTQHPTTTRCTACGAANLATSLFCVRCTAPLAVVSLGQLDDADQQTCISALFETLAGALKADHKGHPASHDKALWNAYLSAFWLRPETALILYAEALAVRSVTQVTDPWLDLGCGDGIHAALRAGWRFDTSFDAFQSLDLTAADMYHHWDASDFTANVVTPGRTIAHGIDIKDTAIARSKALGIFSRVHQADATQLPLPDRSVRTIFSNMLRDLGTPLPAALDECRRVMTDDGTLLISAMTPAYAGNLHFAPAARDAEKQGDSAKAQSLLKLDRGRSVFCQRQLSIDAWQKLLSVHGLKIATTRTIVGPAIIRFWDIGLRPFAVALLKQRQTWRDAGVLPIVKPGIVAFLEKMLDPLVRQLTVGEPCMNLLVVKKA